MLVGVVERIEGVKELFLRSFLAGDELNVINQKNIVIPVAFSKAQQLVVANRVDQFVGELFGRDVGQAQAACCRRLISCPMACIRCVFPRPTPPYMN